MQTIRVFLFLICRQKILAKHLPLDLGFLSRPARLGSRKISFICMVFCDFVSILCLRRVRIEVELLLQNRPPLSL